MITNEASEHSRPHSAGTLWLMAEGLTAWDLAQCGQSQRGHAAASNMTLTAQRIRHSLVQCKHLTRCPGLVQPGRLQSSAQRRDLALVLAALVFEHGRASDLAQGLRGAQQARGPLGLRLGAGDKSEGLELV